MQKILKPDWVLCLLFLIAGISFALRLPAVKLGLPPNIFVDEIFFFDDTYRSLNSSFFFPQAFISGSINEIPFWIAGKIFLLFGGEFTYSNFLAFGRIIGPITLTALTVFPLYKLSLEVNRSRFAAFVSVLLFAFSPWVFANSQIWYPDHYIYFFVTLFLLQLSRIWNKQTGSNTVFLVSTSLALLVSVKYSAAIYALPLLLAPRFMHFRKNESRQFYNYLTLKSVLYSLPIFLILNFSIFKYFHGFLAGMNSNRKNYRFFTESPFLNLIAYSQLSFLISLGIVGSVMIILGFVKLWKVEPGLFKLYSITVFGYLLLLSTSPILFPRNINLLIPLLSVIAGAGALKFAEILKSKKLVSFPLSILVFSISVVSLCCFAQNVDEVTREDSFYVTKRYIEKHLPADAIVGINPGADGPSPVEELGMTAVSDPVMDKSLEFYVFNSYWESPIRSYFYTNGFLKNWSYRDFHFNETSPDSAFVLSKKKVSIEDLVTDGYKIEKVISSVGPTYVILRKVR